MKQIFFLLLTSAGLFLSGCKSHEILPEKTEVKVSREAAAKDCRLIGPVTGSVTKIGESSEKALENMKMDAARKGANFVFYEAGSATGMGLKGQAYFCP